MTLEAPSTTSSSVHWLLRVCLPLLLLAPRHAAADATTAEKAIAIHAFDDAQKLMANGNAASACPKYAESQRLDPQLGTLLHLAECFERTGQTASAWASFKEAVEIAVKNGDPRAPAARIRLGELEPKLARLTIAVTANAPQALEVLQDGALFGRPLWGSAVPVDPGKHVITARAAGHRDWSTAIVVPPGPSSTRVNVPLLSADTATPGPIRSNAPPLARTPAPADASQRAGLVGNRDGAPIDNGSALRTAGYIVGGAGLVSLGLGTFFAYSMQSKLTERDQVNACSHAGGCDASQALAIQHLTDEAKTQNAFAITAWIGGGAALAVGIGLVVAGQPKPVNAATSLRWAPWAHPHGAGFVVGGGW